MRKTLIGLEVSIVDATNKSNIGIRGIVMDDSRSMLTIKTSKGIKKIVKKNAKFKIKIGNKENTVDGNELLGRIDERLRK